MKGQFAKMWPKDLILSKSQVSSVFGWDPIPSSNLKGSPRAPTGEREAVSNPSGELEGEAPSPAQMLFSFSSETDSRSRGLEGRASASASLT